MTLRVTPPRALVAGLGNIFYGDDAFGVAVIDELKQRALPPHLRLVDAGIRALDLTYSLVEGWDVVILVDAAARGKRPGTLFVLELDVTRDAAPSIAPHDYRPEHVVGTARGLGAQLNRVRLVGCQPETLEPSVTSELWSLSAPVSASVKPAADLALNLVSELLETPCTN